jgi:hypothetical protein
MFETLGIIALVLAIIVLGSIALGIFARVLFFIILEIYLRIK